MAIILFDDKAHQTLRPLTFTRPVADLRIGILTIAEKWSKYLNTTHSFLTQPYLQEKFPLTKSSNAIYINGSVCPDECLLDAIDALKPGEALKQNGFLIAAKVDELTPDVVFEREIEHSQPFVAIKYPEDIFSKNNIELRKDFALITKGRTSASVTSTNTIIGNDFFAEDGVNAECSTFNTTNGP